MKDFSFLELKLMVLEEGQSHDLVLISKISLGISVSKPLEPCLAFRDLRQPVLRVFFFKFS